MTKLHKCDDEQMGPFRSWEEYIKNNHFESGYSFFFPEMWKHSDICGMYLDAEKLLEQCCCEANVNALNDRWKDMCGTWIRPMVEYECEP